MNDPYFWIRLVHIVSATVLFGTGLGTAFHMYATHRRGNVAAIAVMAQNTVLADWLFTAPAGVMQVLSGALLIHLAGYDPLESWLVAAYALYIIVGACWLKVVRLQYRMRRLANDARDRGAPLPDAHHRAMRAWFILGWPGFLGLVIVFVLMVMKPTLW